MTWLEETIHAFEALDRDVHVQEIYSYFEKNTSRNLPLTWKASIRKSIEMNSADSKAFSGKTDLFQSVQGINNGFWRLKKSENVSITPFSPDRSELDSDQPEKVLQSIYRFLRDTKMIKELKLSYEHKCQVCGLKIKIKDRFYSEGHHLRPLGRHHSGSDDKNNIIILCPNHHVEFDYGIIAINTDLTLKHANPESIFNGQPILLKHTLSIRNIEYHLKEIFNK